MPRPRNASALWTGKVLPSTALGAYVPVRPKEQPWKTGDEKVDTRRAMARLHPHRYAITAPRTPCIHCGCWGKDKQGGRLIHTPEMPQLVIIPDNPLKARDQKEKNYRGKKRRELPKAKPRKRTRTPEQLARDREAYDKRRGTDALSLQELQRRIEHLKPEPKPKQTPLDLIKVDGEPLYISRNDRWSVERVHVPQNRRQPKGLPMWRVTELVGPSPRRTWDVIDLETARLKIHRMSGHSVHRERAMMDRNYVPD
ncbi:hypothetical protein KHO57_gp026 [Mycobacterium phage Phabba]|uniref:Uncharacterized protein n=1 Tax=Mycobacterium phage Phabba TaxID=2027899 RepID=A0A249XS92_9CAUD|nr:hypothetical protein KHO57_gp026 [Mycobacterium phage Phabba]ASZ74601.1 hypothetical protein SEA_PHABBA_26 [Mycobacterium phage Phabba]